MSMAKEIQGLQLAGLGFDPKSSTPMYRQLYEFLRQAILEGRLRPGQRLPATRALAGELGISRNTVMLAFDYLLSEGYLKGKTGSGTYVTDTLPDNLLYAHHATADTRSYPTKRNMLSKRGQVIAGTQISTTRIPEVIQPFQPGLPALNDFPYDIWARIAARRLRLMPYNSLAYGDPAGYRPLREAIAVYLRTARAVRCEAEQIIIVSGSQQALDLSARVLLDPGDSAWFEDPGYSGSEGALIGAGVRLIPVPVDKEGLDVDLGKALDNQARLVYVTPSHQYPLGVTMSLSRRLQLLDWASQSGAWILEDDYDSEYRYAGRPLSSLQGLDIHDCVIYLGTFSKVLFPALRLGYLVVPRNIVKAFISAKAACDRHCPMFEQMVLAEFIEQGHFGRHIRRMRVLYHQRQNAFLAAVRNELDGLLNIQASDAGLHVVGWLPEDFDDQDASLRAAKLKLTTPPLSAYRIQYKKRPGLVLGYAGFDEKEIKNAVQRLAMALSL